MNFETLRKSDLILYECIVGSQAYGLSLPGSDVDIKGVYIAPIKEFYGFTCTDQINNESNDITYYEIGKFLSLLCKSNPTVLEMLFSPEDCIQKSSKYFTNLDPGKFISKKCEDSFARYAFTQIKKARGLNKKISNPIEPERKSILDFCYVIFEQGSMAFKKWLGLKGLDDTRCGLVAIPHMDTIYAIFYDDTHEKRLGFMGIAKDENSMDVALSSVPKGIMPVSYLYFNKHGFSKYCREFKEYWSWVKNRNEARYETTIKHGKNYDSKNMMHTFRLLEISQEIAVHKKFFVRRSDKEELMKIRSGYYSYEDLITMAEEKLDQIRQLYASADLPDEPDKDYAEKILIQIRRDYYRDEFQVSARKGQLA